ncbi:MAG: hypothetical protein J6S97_03485 [Bacteroidales bacterium]|nr:hypothetical protein [Bacteroidales bacterium]
MKKSLFFLLAAAAAIVSCAKEGLETLPQQERVRFEVTGTEFFPGTQGISPAEATKAFLTDAYTICWEKGKDVVCIFNKNDKYPFTVTLTGTSTWLEGDPLPAISTYYALYPFDENASNTTGTITTTLPAEQKAIRGQFSNIVAVAASKTKEFVFRPCVCLVEIDLQTDGVDKISFRGNNGEPIAGSLRMTASTSEAPDPTIVDGINEVSISDGGAVLEKGVYYLAIAPQEFKKGVTVTLSGKGGSVEKSTGKALSAKRCSRVRTGALALTLIPEDGAFCFEYDDGQNSGVVYPGQEKHLVYSYSGINSLSYNLKSSGSVDVEYFLDGSSSPVSEAPSRLRTGISAGSGILELLPTEESGGLNENVSRLRGSRIRGTMDEPIDLSTDNNTLMGASLSGVNTANCYVVTTPGWYSFPLVYGNAIKGGADNKTAYAPPAGAKSCLSPFIGADGKGITGPYINGSGAKAVSARLEWEDALGLVQKIKLKGSGSVNDVICFEVPAATIREGNALISALDSEGKIVWSWHIWVCGATAQDLTPVTITNKANKTYQFSPVNVGWVAPFLGAITYQGHRTGVRITEKSSGKVIEFTLEQLAGTLPESVIGYCPFYQWGRKDPFPASDGVPCEVTVDATKKVWFTTEMRDTVGTRAAVLGNDIASYIGHPTHYNLSSGGDGVYANIWNATQAIFSSSSSSEENALPIVKSVYDPCPVGCTLPPIGAWSAFSKDNSQGEFNNGMLFYTAPNQGGTTTFYPATGSMSTTNTSSSKVNASLRNVGTGFSYWSGNANNGTSGFSMTCYNKGAVNTTYGSNRQYVYPIRPVIEK